MSSISGTSATPFSVSAYSTRGGTSGNVLRATIPSSSSALSRNDRVRGLIPSSERSSSQNRWLPSARSRISSRVHLPEMISAVRQTGHRELLIALIGTANGRRTPPLLASSSIAPWLHFVKCWAAASQRPPSVQAVRGRAESPEPRPQGLVVVLDLDDGDSEDLVRGAVDEVHREAPPDLDPLAAVRSLDALGVAEDRADGRGDVELRLVPVA